MDRSQKEQWVSDLTSELNKAELIVITRQVGLSAEDTAYLRTTMRQSEAQFKVIKNSLARLALKDTSFSSVIDSISGPVGIAYSKSPLGAAKAAAKFAKENQKLEIVVGAMPNSLLSQEEVKALAELPDLDTLRARLIAIIQTPATRIAGVLQAPAAQLARLFNTYSLKS